MSATDNSSNPEYVSARVRSRRSRLFDEEDYRKLIRMGPSEIARYMEETEYESEMNALGARHSGVDLIEYALNRNLAKHFEDILDWAEGPLYENIARHLRKYDAWNVKTILRGIYSDASRDEIETDLVEAGELDHQLLMGLAESGSIESVVEGFEGTLFGDGLAGAYDDYEATGLLVPLENAVDRAFYENLVADVSGGEATELYQEVLTAEIDFRNVRNALRLARSGADLDPAEYFIEGGDLFDATELSALIANTDELVTRIRESTYGNELDEAMDELEDADSLLGFERAVESALLEYGERLSNVFPLSICPVLSYLLAKEREVANIQAIARGREVGLSEEQIRSELVMP